MRTLLLAGTAALALGMAPAFAASGIVVSHNSVPVAVDGSQAATNHGTNLNDSSNGSGNAVLSGNNNQKTIDSGNSSAALLSSLGNGSATAVDGVAIVNDRNLSETTTKIATSVVNGSVEHNGAGYAPGAIRDAQGNSMFGSLSGQGIMVVQQNTASGALQQNSIALGSVVGSGSGSGIGSSSGSFGR